VQLGGLAERFVDAPERADDGFQRRALAAQVSARGPVRPDVRVL
jgi:hypothetical protein